MNEKEFEFELRKQALDVAMSLNRAYINSKKEWQLTEMYSASDIVDDAEIFLTFLKG